MHDGRYKKLREVVQFYAQSPIFEGKIALTPNERVDLVAFLLTLTDKEFLFNKDLGYPVH